MIFDVYELDLGEKSLKFIFFWEGPPLYKYNFLFTVYIYIYNTSVNLCSHPSGKDRRPAIESNIKCQDVFISGCGLHTK